jgi:hypothetical protein
VAKLYPAGEGGMWEKRINITYKNRGIEEGLQLPVSRTRVHPGGGTSLLSQSR